MCRTLPGWLTCGLEPIVYGDLSSYVAAAAIGASSEHVTCGKGGDFGTPDFFRFVEAKIDVWEHSLSIDDTLFLDLDVEVFADPREDVPSDCDLYAQDDDGATSKGRLMVCTGAIWLRRCHEVLSFLQDVRKTLRRQGSCDEVAANTVLASSSLHVSYAPHDEWQTISRGPRTERTRLLHHNGPTVMTLEKKLASLDRSGRKV